MFIIGGSMECEKVSIDTYNLQPSFEYHRDAFTK
jgi:hypothetical protein